jgi:hypothetical protein
VIATASVPIPQGEIPQPVYEESNNSMDDAEDYFAE